MSPHAAKPLSASGCHKETSKERGCFQCSRRRIVCDRGVPSCAKCIKKGIDCSGVNRIRFAGGVARRGRLKDCELSDERSDGELHLPTKITFPVLRWKNESIRGNKRKRCADRVPTTMQYKPKAPRLPGRSMPNVTSHLGTILDQPGEAEDSSLAQGELPSHALIPATSSQSLFPTKRSDSIPFFCRDQAEIIDLDQDDTNIFSCIGNSLLHLLSPQDPQPWIAPLSAESRMLFSYFSEAVAPAMVVFDTESNGYRQIVLPMAIENECLCQAICVVAAQHLSYHRPEMRSAAEAGRARIISCLLKESMSASASQVFNKFTWATVIVLLVGETVTGSAEFSFLVQMLLSLSANSRSDKDDPTITAFLQTQTDMFELFGMSQLREADGVPATTKFLERWHGWLTFEEFSVGSLNHRTLDNIRLCFAAACTVYIQRATCEDNNYPLSSHPNIGESQVSTMQDLVRHVSKIAPRAPGAHALVWPCFVAGAEAKDPQQRAFFAAYLRCIYEQTRFRNILAAMQGLESIWAMKGERRWTMCLSELSKTLVM